MDDVLPCTITGNNSSEPSQAIFQQEWQIYRTLVDENYLFHREAYECLHQILIDDAVQPFRFLDLACGDATASMAALSGTRISQYHGIDTSQPALDLAKASLIALDCPVSLELDDFVRALRERPEATDVVWIGLSLHHLRSLEKLEVMSAILRVLGPDGLLPIYEATSPDGENRDGWLKRWDDQQPMWSAYSAEDWETINAHVHAADYPETAPRWVSLGHAAGFDNVREVFVAPSDLFRLYSMRASPT